MSRHRQAHGVAAVVFLALGASPRAHAAGKPYAFGPPHAWVVPAKVDPSEASPGGDGAIVDELLDDQVRLAPVYEHYQRRVRRITAIAGTERAGEMSIELDPGYQHLVLHAVRILRGDETIDAARTATFRVLEQENDLDQRIYNGKLTLVVVVGDLRVGDRLDTQYSITGKNPVFGDLLFTGLPLANGLGVKHLRERLLVPASRPLARRTFAVELEPVERVLGDERELVWERSDVPRLPDEDGTPDSFRAFPHVSLSELSSWGQVVAWAAPLYDTAPARSPLLDARVALIAGQAKTPEDRALAALRFVQDEVRYLGMELGQSTHRPHAPAAVLEQRFGDCKDKALLLVTLLRALGVTAHVAFVDTELGPRLDDELPSPGVFDHVIVKIDLPDRSAWVDATRTHERGRLGAVPVRFGRGLVIAPGVTSLSPIDSPSLDTPAIETLERFRLDGFQAALEVVTTYRADEATSMRRRLATTPHGTLQKQYVDFYANSYRSIEPAGDLAVEDDTLQNVVVVRERYTIKDALPERALDVSAATIRSYARRPRVTRRETPFAVGYPAFVRHAIEVSGTEVSLPDDTDVESAALRFTARGTRKGGVTRLSYELRTRASEVAPAEIGAHVRAVESILDATSRSLPVVERRPARTENVGAELGWFFGILGTVGLVAASGTIGATIRRRRWRKKSRTSTGESPAKAMTVGTRAGAARCLTAGRCACGGTFVEAVPESAWTALRFAERDIVAGRVACARCGGARVRYFAVGP